MKKYSLAALALAVAVAAMPTVAYGAGSNGSSGSGGNMSTPSYSSSSDNYGAPPSSSSSANSTSNTTVQVSASGAKTTGATSETEAGGTSFGVVVDATTSTGQAITVNSRGEAVIGNTAVGLAKSEAATAGLPAQVVSAINAINSGADLSSANLGLNLAGYAAMTGTHAVVVKDNATNQVKEGEPVEVSLYVSSLVDGLENVSILFYDNVLGQWKLLPAVKVDPVTKTVSFVIENSGTVCIVHK